MTRFRWLAIVGLALFAAGCSDSATLPPSTTVTGQSANVAACTADPNQILAWINQALNGSTRLGAARERWTQTVQLVNIQHDLVGAQQKVMQITDILLTANRQSPLPIDPNDLTSLINQLFCYVSLEPSVANPNNSWVVHVSDPVSTFVTADKSNGIQLPPNSVTTNTLVTAVPTTSTLNTLLDNYATVYEWSLTPAQTLTPGMTATIGMCPDPAALANVPAGELDALLARLVLGHQKSSTTFEVLARVPLPPQMDLQCPTSVSGSLHASLGQRIMHTLAGILLPSEASAAVRRGFTGGVGGSTSEFSPFGPVDPQLFVSGGVGGSTSEFVRTNRAIASLMSGESLAIDGTVGTTKHAADLATVTVKTFQGTPIPGVTVSYSISGAVPGRPPAGNPSICGSDQTTNDHGIAALTCLAFGTTVQNRAAYSTLTAVVSLPQEMTGLDPQGNPVVKISPSTQNWLITSFGPSNLVLTQPPAGHTVALGNPYTADATIPARVEIRSDLGEVVPTATNSVTLSLNKNGFAGGATSITANAVAGIATFAAQIPTPATGYLFSTAANLGDTGPVNSSAGSNIFDVVPGAAVKLTVIGSANYGTVMPTANPVSPSPTVLVTDANNNPKAGVPVFWTPMGATGSTANTSGSQTSTVTASDGRASAPWLLGVGTNQLRVSLQSTAGGAEVFFVGVLPPPDPSQPCEPGAVRNAFGICYFVTPGTQPGGTLFRMGNWLSTGGQ